MDLLPGFEEEHFHGTVIHQDCFDAYILTCLRSHPDRRWYRRLRPTAAHSKLFIYLSRQGHRSHGEERRLVLLPRRLNQLHSSIQVFGGRQDQGEGNRSRQQEAARRTMQRRCSTAPRNSLLPRERKSPNSNPPTALPADAVAAMLGPDGQSARTHDAGRQDAGRRLQRSRLSETVRLNRTRTRHASARPRTADAGGTRTSADRAARCLSLARILVIYRLPATTSATAPTATGRSTTTAARRRAGRGRRR